MFIYYGKEYMITYKIPCIDTEKEIFYLLKITGITKLSIASNYPYELYISNNFINDGDYRYTDEEIYIRDWSEELDILESDSIRI